MHNTLFFQAIRTYGDKSQSCWFPYRKQLLCVQHTNANLSTPLRHWNLGKGFCDLYFQLNAEPFTPVEELRWVCGVSVDVHIMQSIRAMFWEWPHLSEMLKNCPWRLWWTGSQIKCAVYVSSEKRVMKGFQLMSLSLFLHFQNFFCQGH